MSFLKTCTAVALAVGMGSIASLPTHAAGEQTQAVARGTAPIVVAQAQTGAEATRENGADEEFLTIHISRELLMHMLEAEGPTGQARSPGGVQLCDPKQIDGWTCWLK
jgi:hypothetical protein